MFIVAAESAFAFFCLDDLLPVVAAVQQIAVQVASVHFFFSLHQVAMPKDGVRIIVLLSHYGDASRCAHPIHRKVRLRLITALLLCGGGVGRLPFFKLVILWLHERLHALLRA